MVASRRTSEGATPSDRREAARLGMAPIVMTAFACFLLFAVSWVAPALYGSQFNTHNTAALRGCRFGSQPYYFEDNAVAFNETPSKWRLRAFEKACQPKQLFKAMTNASIRGDDGRGGGRQLVIALFGDRYVRQVCLSRCMVACVHILVNILQAGLTVPDA